MHSRGLKFGPIAEANHAAESTLGCDPVITIFIFVIVMIFIFVVIFVITIIIILICVIIMIFIFVITMMSIKDYGWSDGADGTGKCYMLIKNFDYRFAIIHDTCS